MREYTPFAISNFRTGFNESVEPWLLPRDGYQVVVNAHLYRGVLEKIEGYSLFARFTNRVFHSLGTPDGVQTTFVGVLPSLPVSSNFYAYGTIIVRTTSETFSYSSSVGTVVTLVGSAGGIGTIDIATGAYSITFNTAPPLSLYSSVFLIYDAAPSVVSAIMGIKQYYTNTGEKEVLVFDQKRVGIIQLNQGILATQTDASQTIVEIPHDYYQSAIFTGDAVTVLFTGTLAGAPLVPGTLVWTEYTSTGVPTGRVITDYNSGNPVGSLSGTDVTSGSVNYSTGAYRITFTVAPATGNYFDSTIGVYGDLFTGTISNFFTFTNYQFKGFFTNNVDPIFYYDGISIHYLNTSFTARVISSSGGVPTFGGNNGYNITRCLHVFTYQNRLLLIAPTVDGIQQVSTIYWSKIFLPLDFTNQEFLPAPTSQPIKAFGYINTDLVIRFSNSERIFRYTADAFSPFRWDSTNNIWACDAPYSAINYDTWFSSVGRPAIVGSDAVNVKRVDEIIPDFTDPTSLAQQVPVPYMSQTSIRQCYGERYDDIKEGWLCYNSGPSSQAAVTASDNVLAFNYLDSTYAVYTFPFSCLGFGQTLAVETWNTTLETWASINETWDSYQFTLDSLIGLAGDQFDKVYQLNDGNSMGDETTPVLMNVISKNFNPFIEQGQLCRFGYVDLFVSAYQQTRLRVQFYLNDELYIDSNDQPAGYYKEELLTFTPTDAMSPTMDQVKVWKRIYIGSVGKSHTVRFYQAAEDFTPSTLGQPVYIHSMVLYMKPAGRIFN